MSAKITVITGPTSGIGKETALELARQDHAIYLLVRDMERGEQLRESITGQTGNKAIYAIQCDLTDLESVQRAADELASKLSEVNVLINNAGGIFPRKELSKDGFEMTFALNHLGHFALTMHLMPLLEKGHARIINVSSEAHKTGKPDFNNLRGEKPYSAKKAYATTKLYNIFFTESLADRCRDKGISTFALHPGVVKTNFGDGVTGFSKLLLWLARPFMISPEKGAKTSVYLATKPKLEIKSGGYFIKRKKMRLSDKAINFSVRNQLWNISLQLVGMKDMIAANYREPASNNVNQEKKTIENVDLRKYIHA
jgi:NAD(P)-dependent dehydrogenase (short-subunit alcohol dehydrogenase family)